MKEKIAAFDVDAVILDLHSAYAEVAKSLGFKNSVLRNSRDTRKRFGTNNSENNQVFKSLQWDNFPLTPWATDLTDAVKRKGYKIIFVSACKPKNKNLRFANLRNFFNVSEEDVHCVGGADKSITLSAFKACAFIDDSPDIILQCQKHLEKSFLLDLGFDDIDSSGVKNKFSIESLLQHIDKNF